MTSSGEQRLRALLLLAAAGALVVLLGFLGTIAELVGVAAIVLATLLSAPPTDAAAPQRSGVGWWRLLATGATISVIALPLSLLLETPGGLLAAIGGALVIVAAAFGYPR